jgi:hypothetical protein
MHRLARRFNLVAISLFLGATACLPYTVGSTAYTVPTGQTTSSTSYYFIPNAYKHPGDSVAHPLAGVDYEWRHGLDPRSDLGLRLTSGSGVVINYKHRFSEYGSGTPALAYMVGTGILNSGEHLHLEATLIASGDEASAVMPFGGLRAMQLVPMSQSAAYASPTIGAFGGVELGDAAFTLRPEVGLFYDHSAPSVRPASFIIVPAITVQRAPRQSEMSTIVPPAMRGPRRNRRSNGVVGRIRCVLFGCVAAP